MAGDGLILFVVMQTGLGGGGDLIGDVRHREVSSRQSACKAKGTQGLPASGRWGRRFVGAVPGGSGAQGRVDLGGARQDAAGLRNQGGGRRDQGYRAAGSPGLQVCGIRGKDAWLQEIGLIDGLLVAALGGT